MKYLHFHVRLIDGVFSPKSPGQLRFHRVNAPTSKRAQRVGSDDQRPVARYLERRWHPARDGWFEMSCSDHLNLALDDEEGATLQQLPQPLDHVPDSHGASCGTQSAQRANNSSQGRGLWRRTVGTESA
ncbi:hypothetical protein N9383_01155 [Granulosicoccus sp.]|nr:hypothetical protein [Granulosicoccus sp.]